MTRLRPLTLVIALAGLMAVLLPAAPSEAGGREPVRFTLGGTVLDGGEQVTSLTLDARRLGAIRASSLSTATFTVRAVGRIPAGVDPGTQPVVAYDAARTVSAAALTDAGRIRLDLVSGPTVTNASTLAYLAGPARNVQLDLSYTITQTAPLTLRSGRSLTIERFGRVPSSTRRSTGSPPPCLVRA